MVVIIICDKHSFRPIHQAIAGRPDPVEPVKSAEELYALAQAKKKQTEYTGTVFIEDHIR